MSSVQRSLRLLEAIAGGPAPTHAELSRRFSIPRSTLTQLLELMRESGYVSASEGRYYPGLQLMALGFRLSQGQGNPTALKPEMDALARASGETVTLGVRINDRVIYIAQSPSPQPVRYVAEMGRARPLHATASGKVFLAHAPTSPADGPLEALTDRTVTTLNKLRRDVAEVLRDGYAVNFGESVTNVTGISAPLFWDGARPTSVLSVTGPSDRMVDARERVWPLLRESIAALLAKNPDARGPGAKARVTADRPAARAL